MHKLCHAPNLALAHFWVQVLQDQGVACCLQREFLAGGAGELPPDQCLPEVWVFNAEDLPKAEQLLHALTHQAQHQWQCICGERIEGGFEQCWACGELMPSPPSSSLGP